jgi:hypothetical protein
MWLMMRKPEPIIGIGGTQATRSLLPRMKWKQLSRQADNFILRLSSGVLLEHPIKRLPLPGKEKLIGLAHRIAVPIRRVRRHLPSTGGADVQELKAFDLPTGVAPSISDYAIARLVDRNELEWLHLAPAEMGKFSCLVFSLEGKPVGLSVNRLYSREHNREAYIMHIQASQASTEIYAWIVSATATHLGGLGATAIRCRTTCPIMADSLRRTGFSHYSSFNVRWWSSQRDIPIGNALMSMLRADDGFMPYPTK